MQAFLLSLYMLVVTGTKETFDEELLIKDLGSGYSAFHFNFVSKVPEFVTTRRHHNIIPISIYRILENFHVDELHLSMVRGFWDDEFWGPHFITSAPSGAELLAWFRDNITNVERSWFELTHALSGQFCASLSRLSSRQNSVIPSWVFRKTGISAPYTKLSSKLVRYGQLPEEALCSENFTPWVKLLPCKRLAGLANIIRPTAIFRSNYNGITIGVRRICWDPHCIYVGLELRQTITIVFDRRILYQTLEVSWSPKQMLGGELRRTCDPARSSRVFVLSSPNNLSWTPTDLNQSYQLSSDQYLAVYDSEILQNDVFKRLLFSTSVQHVPLRQPVSVSKLITGSGSINGGVRNLITSHADFPITLVFFDVAPWFTQVLFSTLKMELFNADQNKWESIEPVKYALQPSLTRKRMATIELVVALPPNRQLAISYKFRKLLQRWNEFPTDANHGYSLPSASVSYKLTDEQLKAVERTSETPMNLLTLPNWASTYADYFNNSAAATKVVGDSGRLVRIYSTIVLVTLPTPDFSMPFNVLCFVCSLISVIVGIAKKVTMLQLTAIVPRPGVFSRIRNALKRTSSLRAIIKRFGKSDSHEKKE